jgi:hypothetical protein
MDRTDLAQAWVHPKENFNVQGAEISVIIL